MLIADDHPILRQGLGMLIDQEPDLVVCGEAESPHQTLEAIEKLNPDITLIDIAFKDSSGIELMEQIKARYPKLPMLAISMHNETFYAERALRAGAKGYIMKEESTQHILKAVRQVLSGGIYLSQAMSEKLLHKIVNGKEPENSHPGVESLSNRELEVLQFIGKGFSNGLIAEKMCLSVKTIESYREHIKIKLDLESAAALRQYAVQWVQTNLLPPGGSQ